MREDFHAQFVDTHQVRGNREKNGGSPLIMGLLERKERSKMRGGGRVRPMGGREEISG